VSAAPPQEAELAVGFRSAALHLGGLWALAFAQPLFALLGRSAEFFVARGNTTGDILLLALGYALLPPLVGALVVWALGRVRPVLGRAALLALLAVLVAALFLPALGDLLSGSSLAIPLALVVGAAAAALYRRRAGVRTLVGVLGAAPLVVLVLFLVLSPVHELVFPTESSGAVAGPSRSSTPIVQIVLDELAVSTIDSGNGRIDAALFPNLARLARTATWYREATTVDGFTPSAVPALLTGSRPAPGALPTAADHPHNLFTLFARSHDLLVVEPITDLCPAALCREVRPPQGERLASLRSDLAVVAGHLLLPGDLDRRLPSVAETWENFGGDAPGPRLSRDSGLLPDVLERLAANDAPAGFARVTAALARPRARPPLVFMHSTLPHGPWRYLPDGRRYALRGWSYTGLLGRVWTSRQWLVDQGFQRHLLQAQYTDGLVGRLLDRLRASGLFDRAVIVVTADHGLSMRAGAPRRLLTPASLSGVATVPFIVKWPGQRRGAVDDAAVRTVDVLPTIAKAARVRLPWPVDGVPADEREPDPNARIAVGRGGAGVQAASLRAVQAARRRQDAHERRVLRDGVWGIGSRPDLLGRRVRGTAARPAAGRPGAAATLDHPEDYRSVDAGARVLPLLLSGRVRGLPRDAPLAVAVNGIVSATTRVWALREQRSFSALLPPEALVDGPNAVTVLAVRRDGRLQALGGTTGRG
jgi:sulfatase-like protein